MLTLLFDGVAYGMLLFILSIGLAVTLGLMNFINLAHGAFAMAGGYTTVLLMQHAGLPFLLCVPRLLCSPPCWVRSWKPRFTDVCTTNRT